MINFHSKSYFVSLHLWSHILMWLLHWIIYDNDGHDSREWDDDASEDSVRYVDHSYSISQRFFRTVRGFDFEVTRHSRPWPRFYRGQSLSRLLVLP